MRFLGGIAREVKQLRVRAASIRRSLGSIRRASSQRSPKPQPKQMSAPGSACGPGLNSTCGQVRPAGQEPFPEGPPGSVSEPDLALSNNRLARWSKTAAGQCPMMATSRAMQTHFTEIQLRDPHLAEADGIIGTCVHYGFCTNTCPTYVLTRDENEFSARPHRSHPRHAGARRRARREDRASSRQLPLVSVLHDDLRGQGRLRASDRPGARSYRTAISAVRSLERALRFADARSLSRIRAVSRWRYAPGAAGAPLRPTAAGATARTLLDCRPAQCARRIFSAPQVYPRGRRRREARRAARRLRAASAVTPISMPRRSGCSTRMAVRW